MNIELVSHYVKVSQNHNKRVLLNVGGQIVTGFALDIENSILSDSTDINKTTLERITRHSKECSSQIIFLTDVQVYFNSNDYIDYKTLSVNIESINFIRIQE